MQEVIEFFKNAPFFGDATIAVIVVILILRGQLVPRRNMEDIIGERDAWRQAYLDETETNREIRRQNGELLEVAKITEHLLTSFKEKSS